jgi:hypothetical protein
MNLFRQRHILWVCLVAAGAFTAACDAPKADVPVLPNATYDRVTGRLVELRADTNSDGKDDAIAHMDGTHLKSIDVDRDGDGKADRWESYEPGVPANQAAPANPFDRWAIIARVEESNRPDGQITRRETYEHGVIQRVEDDTNLDGHPDKWEYYTSGVLTHVDLDLGNKGFADRRLIYERDGSVSRIEVDPDGHGHFVPMPPDRATSVTP